MYYYYIIITILFYGGQNGIPLSNSDSLTMEEIVLVEIAETDSLENSPKICNIAFILRLNDSIFAELSYSRENKIIPNNYRKITKGDIIKKNILKESQYLLSDFNDSCNCCEKRQKNENDDDLSFYLQRLSYYKEKFIHVYFSDEIINGYLPDSCFVNKK